MGYGSGSYWRAALKGLIKGAGMGATAAYGLKRAQNRALRRPARPAKQAKKYNRPGTGTKISAQVSLHQRAHNDGQGGSRSKFFYGKRKLPRAYAVLKRALPKNYYLTNTSGRASITVGQQYNQMLLTMFNQTDINSISNLINSGSNSKTNRFCLMSVSANAMITNQDQGNCYLDIYDVIARRDLSASTVSNPLSAWNGSYADEGGSNTDSQVVGATPFSSDLFTQYFKVLKITHVILGQGQTHNHQVYFRPNRQMDGEYLQYMQNGAKGLTCFSFMVFRGAPTNDTMIKSQVSTGQCQLDYVTSKQYKYTWIQDIDTTWSKTNSLPSSFTTAESVMDIGSGSAVTDTPA